MSEKRTVGHSLLRNLIALASMARPATLNVQLGAQFARPATAEGELFSTNLPTQSSRYRKWG